MKLRFDVERFKHQLRTTLIAAPTALSMAVPPAPVTAQVMDVFPTAIEAPIPPSAIQSKTVAADTLQLVARSSTQRLGKVDLPFASAIDALKLVENGDFEVRVPMKSGERISGFKIRPGTVLKVSMQIRDGQVDMNKMHMRFSPALDGPLWIDVQGIVLTASGNASVQVRGMPRAETKDRGTARLDQVARQLLELTGRETMDVRVLGKKIVSVPAPDLEKVMSLDAEELIHGTSLENLTVSARNMSFRKGEVALGEHGSLRLGEGGMVELSGSPEHLVMRGALDVQKLTWFADGVRIDSISGGGKVHLDYRNPDDGPPSLSGNMQNVRFGSGRMQIDHPKGNLSVARAEVSEGTVRFDDFQPLPETKGALPSKPRRLEVRLPNVEAEIQNLGGRVSTPIGAGEFHLGTSSFDGSVAIDSTGAIVRGEGSLDARVRDVQVAHAGASARIGQASAKVSGEATVRAEADLFMRTGVAVEQPAQAQVMPHVQVTASGQAEFEATDVELRGPGVFASTSAAEGRVGGSVSMDSRRVGEADATDLSASVTLGRGRVTIGDQLDLQLLPGTSFEGALRSLTVRPSGPSAQLQPGAKVSAGFSGGRVTLPSGERLNLGQGKLMLRLDEATLATDRAPSATGTLTLEARGSAPTATLPMARAENAEGSVKLQIGRFRIEQDGTFELLGVKVQVEGGADRVTGRMPTMPKLR